MKSAFELLAAGGALEAVAKERERQDARWGVQDHAHEVWLAILGEEYGELARAILETRFDNGPEAKARGGIENIRKEAVQIAAVAVAMVECLDRQKKQRPPARYVRLPHRNAEDISWYHCSYCGAICENPRNPCHYCRTPTVKIEIPEPGDITAWP